MSPKTNKIIVYSAIFAVVIALVYRSIISGKKRKKRESKMDKLLDLQLVEMEAMAESRKSTADLLRHSQKSQADAPHTEKEE